MTEPTQTWTVVQLGDVLIGDTVRTIDAKIAAGSRYTGCTGTIVGIRSGSVTVRIGSDSVVFWPDQLEKLVISR